MTKWIVALLSGLTLAAAQPDPNAAKEVLAASDALKQAMMKKDAAGLQKLLHEDLAYRSEEHTSELQSRQYIVCRLLLEKTRKRKTARQDETKTDYNSHDNARSAPN